MGSDSPTKTLGDSWQTVSHAATHANDVDFLTGTAGSDQSVTNQVNPSTWLFGAHGLAGQNGQSAWNMLSGTFNQKGVTPQTPGAPPNAGDVRQQVLESELQQERNTRSTWSMFTGGAGLLDAPTTNSPKLLGS